MANVAGGGADISLSRLTQTFSVSACALPSASVPAAMMLESR